MAGILDQWATDRNRSILDEFSAGTTSVAASPGGGGVQQQHTGQVQLQQHTEHLQQQHTTDEATTRLRGRFVRRYRWGMLDVLDERHSDFVAL
jgi:hypothetical protein